MTIEERQSRYYTNSKKESFSSTLKGLTVIEINPSERCTRHCDFCPRGHGYKNESKFLSIGTSARLATELNRLNYGGDIHLAGFGEPLLNTRLIDNISIMRQILPNNRIALTTNGDVLVDGYLNKLLNAGVSFIVVSCYEKSRANEMTELFESHNFKNYDLREFWYDKNQTTEDFIKDKNFNNRAGYIQEGTSSNPCYLPFYKMFIDWNGDVLLCCNDWNKTVKAGNVNKKPLDELWHGKTFNAIRDNLKVGNRCDKPCDKCNVQGVLVGKESVERH